MPRSPAHPPAAPRRRARRADPRGLIVLLLASPAAADPSWHAGAEGRAELGLHPVRVSGGVTFGDLDVSAVVDPLVLLDGQHDLDLEATHRLGCTRWWLGGGLRTTAIAVTGGTTWQEQLLLAATAPLPSPSAHLRATFGVELGMFVVEGGGGLDTEWVSWSHGRIFFESYDVGLFVRFEYAR